MSKHLLVTEEQLRAAITAAVQEAISKLAKDAWKVEPPASLPLKKDGTPKKVSRHGGKPHRPRSQFDLGIEPESISLGRYYGWGDLIYEHWPEDEFYFLDAMAGLIPVVKDVGKNATHGARKALLRDPRFEKLTTQTGRTASRFRKVKTEKSSQGQGELNVDVMPASRLRALK